MPSQQVFSYYYSFGYDPFSATSVYPDAVEEEITLADTIDGNDDGETADDSSVGMYGDSFPFGNVGLYSGTTANGDPVIQYNGQHFVISNNPSLASQAVGEIQAEPFVYCFGKGTRIATPNGECAVEDLKIGDMVRTADGAAIPVKWVGRQTLSALFRPAERLLPVRFAAGALGDGVPHADLTVTGDHAVLIDGVLCHAAALVNATTITRVPLDEIGAHFTVYHVETDNHAILLANGAPAETFIDNVSRRSFDNFAEYRDLYGDEAEMVRLDLPRALSPRQVPAAIRARLAGTIRKTA